MTRCHFIRLACLVAWAVPAQAEIVWLNDWDSPQEVKGWASAVTVMTSEKDGFQAHRDLDGDSRYGQPGLKAERPTWGVEEISAPEGFAFANIVLVWGPVQHHKPCSAGYKLAVSATGKFDGEEVAAQTPDSTGHSTLRLDLSHDKRFQRIGKLFVQLSGWQNCGWSLSCGGIVATADIVEADTGRRVSPPARLLPPPRNPVDFRPFAVDPGTRVTIDAGRALIVNGFGRIEPEVFSLTAYEGAPDFDSKAGEKGVNFCREYGIEGIGFPASMGWVIDGPWWSEWSHEQIDEWFDSGRGWEMFTNYGAWTARYVHGRIMPNLRSVGTRPFLYLYGPEPPFQGCGEGDCMEKWIHVSNRYLEMCLKADPDLEWIHLFGEPNARWFRDNVGADDYARFFNRWADETKKRFPQLNLGGPVTWGTPTVGPGWDGWCKTFMDRSNQHLDFLDWHSYGPGPGKLEGDIHAVSGYMKQHYGKWIRNSLSETNFNVGSRDNWHDTAIHYRRRAIPMMRQTFELLRNPDKLFSRQFHDYGAWVGSYDARFAGDKKMPVTPMMRLFKCFKPLRGRRVVTINPLEEILIEASVENDHLVVAVGNTSEKPRRVPLSVDGLPAGGAESVSATLMTVNGLSAYEIPKDRVLEMPPKSLIVAEFHVAEPIRVATRLRRWEYFGDDFLVRIGRVGNWEVSTSVRLSESVREAATAARLRFGIVGDGDAPSQEWTVEIDGQSFRLDRTLPFYELRLARVPPDDVVAVRLTANAAPQAVYALSFVSLVLDGDCDYHDPVAKAAAVGRQPIWVNDFGTRQTQKAWASATTPDTGADRDGDGRGGRINLVNAERSVWGVEKVMAPRGRTLENIFVEWDVYRATPNGADWMIELSPTGKFSGEQLKRNTPPGVGRVSLTLDAESDARFRKINTVYVRLSGANGVVDWSAQAGPVRLLASLAP